jgi:hypothetical protein
MAARTLGGNEPGSSIAPTLSWDNAVVDAGWFAVIGGGTVAAANGLFDWLKTVSNNRNERHEADAQRTHEVDQSNAQREREEAERNAQREHDRRAAVRAERAEEVREWREGLAASHAEFEEWLVRSTAAEGRPASMGRPVKPNIVSAVWFQSLRPYLLETGRPSQLRSGDELECDSDVADVLASEITRIQKEWLDEADG